MTAKVSFVSLFLALATFSTSHAGVTDCLNVAYEGEIETVNGLAASTYTLPRLKFHVIFHQDGSISYTESALFKANDVVGERTAIGNWEEKDESVAFTLFQSVVDQSNALFFGCDDYACKNTILGKLDFAPDCSTFTFNWSQTILGEDGQPAPSLFYPLGKNYIASAGSGKTSSIDDVRALFIGLDIPEP